MNHQQQGSMSVQPEQKLVDQGQFLLAKFRAETDAVSQQPLTDEQRKRIKANVLKNMNQPTLNIVETQTPKPSNFGRLFLKYTAPVAAVLVLVLGLMQVTNLFRSKDTAPTPEKGIFTKGEVFLAPELAAAADDDDASRNHLMATETNLEATESPAAPEAEYDGEARADNEEYADPAESPVATGTGAFDVKVKKDFGQWDSLFVQIMEQAQWILVNDDQISELRNSLAQIWENKEINLTIYQKDSLAQTARLGYLCLSIDYSDEQTSYIVQTESLLEEKGWSFDLIENSDDMLEFLSSTEAQLKQIADQIVDAANWTEPGNHILIWLLAK
ncbi:MAG: hypothetical protein ACOYEL_00835 [Saccharofermentanales bacterium]